MFRVISSFVPSPRFLMLCDDVTCALMITRPVNFAGGLVTIGSDNRASIMQQEQAKFLDEARAEGWLVSLGAMFCPGHNQAIRASQKAQNEKRITVPELVNR
jgi:hypothetical protein